MEEKMDKTTQKAEEARDNAIRRIDILVNVLLTTQESTCYVKLARAERAYINAMELLGVTQNPGDHLYCPDVLLDPKYETIRKNLQGVYETTQLRRAHLDI
jgi:hypothetical protein